MPPERSADVRPLGDQVTYVVEGTPTGWAGPPTNQPGTRTVIGGGRSSAADDDRYCGCYGRRWIFDPLAEADVRGVQYPRLCKDTVSQESDPVMSSPIILTRTSSVTSRDVVHSEKRLLSRYALVTTTKWW